MLTLITNDLRNYEYERFLKPKEKEIICFSNKNYESLIMELINKMIKDSLNNVEILIENIDTRNREICRELAEDIYYFRVNNNYEEMLEDEDLFCRIEEMIELEIFPIYFSDNITDDIENMVYKVLKNSDIEMCLEGEYMFYYPVLLNRWNEDIGRIIKCIPREEYSRDTKFIMNSSQTLLESFAAPIMKYGNDFILLDEKTNDEKLFIGEKANE